MTPIEVIQGDITELSVDAIVNAANESLLGGGGVDGAIHRAAGRELVAACRLLDGCRVGEAKITPGFKLPAGYVIHTVGPRWRGGAAGEATQLALCYRNALALARAHGCGSIAFPAISTGVFGYPAGLAAELAVTTIVDDRAQHGGPDRVILVGYDALATMLLREAVAAHDPAGQAA
ncbi:MAG: O-acetyl-ADP-ribose deacetylase [Kofleriaceae bacterium]